LKIRYCNTGWRQSACEAFSFFSPLPVNITDNKPVVLSKIIPFCIGLLIFCSPFFANGQHKNDSLEEVDIFGKKEENLSLDQRKNFTAGQQNQKLDTALKVFYQMQSLAQLLAEQSTVFVKSYGVNGLASLSFRGASAAQSAVLWNGIPLSNPTLGMADISLLNSGLFDDISLQYGSSSALYGSGNVGGALLLENKLPDFLLKKNVELTLGLGSYGRKDIAVQSLFQNERWRLKSNFFYQNVRNDFEYLNNADSLLKMENAAMSGFGGIVSVDYNLDKNKSSDSKHILSLQLWYQEFDREIPPALFESFSVKNQLDRSFRSLVHWQKKQKRSSFYAKASYNIDYLRFRDGVVLPNNENSVAQFYSEAGWTFRLDNVAKKNRLPFAQHILLFAPVQFGTSFNKDANLKMQQWRPALVAAYKLESDNERFSLNASIRQEWVAVEKSATLPGISALYQLFQKQNTNSFLKLGIRCNIQKSYRLPTLNELYFSPGGNPNLLPERGWNEDGGFVFEISFQKDKKEGNNKLTLKQETNLFNRNIKDWIYWLGGSIWTPHNLAEVHSRGIETENSIRYQTGNWKFNVSINTAYILSTTVASYMPNDGSIGKQIPYAPRYSGQMNFGIHYGFLFVNYNHQYTGYRFVTVDESQYLKPYQIGNLQAVYKLQWKDYNLGISAQVLNIGNKDYEVVNARPMPRRHFLLGVQLGI